MKDPEPYLTALDTAVRCAVERERTAVVDAAHRSRVNWELFYFSSLEHKRRFDADPIRYCGLITDPVSMERFQPDGQSPHLEYENRPYFLTGPSTFAVFKARPDTLAAPRPRMRRM